MSSSSVSESDLASQFSFPTADLVPKTETEAAAFLRQYPDYDGRGTVIAIIDTGVDPLAKGLQETTTGEKKLIDCIDTTGSGDVDTSTEVSPDEEGLITGLTGRKLKIPSEWTVKEGTKFHIGVKNVFDLYYPRTKKRLMEKRRQAFWDTEHEKTLSQLRKRQIELEALLDKKSANESEELKLKEEKEDVAAQIKVLTEMDKKFPDQGAVCDVITWNDGTKGQSSQNDPNGERRTGWCVCVDTSFSGDLSSCQVLRPYREEFEVSRFTDECMVNFNVDVYGENAETTVIVATSSAHGTHVAAIASAYRPDNPDLNGIAPGAQIVSIKIGDSRLDAMETGTAMIRAMDYCCKNRIDVANYSFGEPLAFHSVGRIMKSIERAIMNFNLCFVTSHGNNGPGLRTGGAPGNCCEGAFTVSAYMSPAMRKAQYAMDNPNRQSANYFWSSRGPCMDGGMGGNICAPGAAITSVPNTLLKGEELMNGTSMASPNAAGNVSLIISGLKQKMRDGDLTSLTLSPHSILRSVLHTAQKMPDHCPFSAGAGVIQTLKAFNHYKENTEAMKSLNGVYFGVSVGAGSDRGILLQEKHHFTQSSIHRALVSVETKLPPSATNDEKVDFTLSVALTASESWVSVPSCLYLTNNSKSFRVTVDVSQLKPGAHHAQILAYDANNFAYGPVFRVPVSVLKPVNEESKETEFSFENIRTTTADTVRRFLRPPEGSSFATVKVTSLNTESQVRYYLAFIQIKSGSMYSDMSKDKQCFLEPGTSKSFSFPVVPGLLTEVCLGHLNSWAPESHVKMEVSFHGISPSQDKFSMHHFSTPLRIDIQNKLSRVMIEPSGSLNHLVTPLRPSEYKIYPLDRTRDLLYVSETSKNSKDLMISSTEDAPDYVTEAIYGLELTYQYSHSAAKDKEVFPDVPLLSSVLYESVFDSQLWTMYNTNTKEVVGHGDFKASKYSCPVAKGDYTIKLWIRHPSYDTLEKLQSLQMVVARKVPAINLSFSTSLNLVDDTFRQTGLNKWASTHMFVAPVAEDKLPKGYSAGSYLTGTIGFLADEPGKSANTYPFMYALGSAFTAPKKEGNGLAANKATPKVKTYQEYIREAKLAYLQKKTDVVEEDAIKMFEELKYENPEEVSVYLAYAAYLAGTSEKQLKHSDKLLSLCDETLALLNMDAILLYYGCHEGARKLMNANAAASSNTSAEGATGTVTPQKGDDGSQGAMSVGENEKDGEKSVDEPKTEESAISLDKSASSSSSSGSNTSAKEMEKSKSQATEILQRKLLCLLEKQADMSKNDDNNDATSDDVAKSIDDTWLQLKKLSDPLSDSKLTQAGLKYNRYKKRFGLVLSKTIQEYESSNSLANLKAVKEVLNDLGWKHVVTRLETSTLLVRFPPGFEPH